MKSWIARTKTQRILRIPAGDPLDGSGCECGEDCLLTEAGETIQTESTSECLRPES